MVVIRNARSHEARRLAEIGLAAWEHAVAGWGEDVEALRPNAQAAYAVFTRDNWPIVRVAELDLRVVGWGAREKSDDHVSDLWVDPAFQGRGAGSALLDAIEAEIREAGYDSASIETHARNLRAIELYKRRGYTVCALSTKYSASLDRDIETIELRRSLDAMTTDDDLARALELLAADGYRTGDGWREAHEIAQRHEGEAAFDRLHALCHRIEGDQGNAGYWYRRAGTEPFQGDFAEEAKTIGGA